MRHRSQFAFDSSSRILHRFGVGHIQRQDNRLATKLLDIAARAFKSGPAPGNQTDPRAFPGKRLDRGTANSR